MPRGLALDKYRQTPSWSFLPAGMLPFCAWGCAIYSFTDCLHPDGRVWASDPNGGRAGREALFDQEVNLADWLQQCVAGKLDPTIRIPDPQTGQRRAHANAALKA